MAFLLIEIRLKANEFLGIVRLSVGFTGDALSFALFMVESREVLEWGYKTELGGTNLFPCSFCHRSIYSF